MNDEVGHHRKEALRRLTNAGERKDRTAAELLREVAAADPEAHDRALARGYGVGPEPTEAYLRERAELQAKLLSGEIGHHRYAAAIQAIDKAEENHANAKWWIGNADHDPLSGRAEDEPTKTPMVAVEVYLLTRDHQNDELLFVDAEGNQVKVQLTPRCMLLLHDQVTHGEQP